MSADWGGGGAAQALLGRLAMERDLFPGAATKTNATTWPELAELVLHHHHFLRIARQFSIRDAEDLLQEAYVRALEKRGSWRADTNVRAWMRTVLRNLAIDRSRSGRHLVVIAEASGLGALVPASMDDDSTSPDQREHPLEEIWSLIPRCRGGYREVLELRYLRKHSYAQIAVVLRIPVSTVGTRLRRARAHLRMLASGGVESLEDSTSDLPVKVTRGGGARSSHEAGCRKCGEACRGARPHESDCPGNAPAHPQSLASRALGG
jgi:RNA polymerase sigma-70 factor (ECF subfamily)